MRWPGRTPRPRAAGPTASGRRPFRGGRRTLCHPGGAATGAELPHGVADHFRHHAGVRGIRSLQPGGEQCLASRVGQVQPGPGRPPRLRAFGPARVADRDVAAFLAQAGGDRLAGSRASAGDESHLVLQYFHDVLPGGAVVAGAGRPVKGGGGRVPRDTMPPGASCRHAGRCAVSAPGHGCHACSVSPAGQALRGSLGCRACPGGSTGVRSAKEILYSERARGFSPGSAWCATRAGAWSPPRAGRAAIPGRTPCRPGPIAGLPWPHPWRPAQTICWPMRSRSGAPRTLPTAIDHPWP